MLRHAPSDSIDAMNSLPSKLKRDAIAESLCELRFVSEELQELVVGQLAANPAWKEFSKTRLPTSDIPEPIRAMDPTLKFQPILQLSDKSGCRIVKVGSNVISYHILRPYCGWDKFYEELSSLIQFLFPCFERFANFSLSRLGFRYINLLNSVDHYISHVRDLSCAIKIGTDVLDTPINLNYLRKHGDFHAALVKLASPEFVTTSSAETFSALIDLDVFTCNQIENQGVDFILNWLNEAHKIEKQEFFSLIPEDVLEKLAGG